MTVLVTGTGIIGAGTARLLAARGERSCLLDAAPQAEAVASLVDSPLVEIVQGDVTDYAALAGLVRSRRITAPRSPRTARCAHCPSARIRSTRSPSSPGSTSRSSTAIPTGWTPWCCATARCSAPGKDPTAASPAARCWRSSSRRAGVYHVSSGEPRTHEDVVDAVKEMDALLA
jgi:nucleoside-diphosphate-sugar epimerase